MAATYVLIASIPSTAVPHAVFVTFNDATVAAAAFRNVTAGWAISNGWNWLGAGEGSSSLVAVTGSGVSFSLSLNVALDVNITFTLQGASGPLATHITPAYSTSDSYTFDVQHAAVSMADAAVMINEFLNPS